jgi:hypothetical protein
MRHATSVRTAKQAIRHIGLSAVSMLLVCVIWFAAFSSSGDRRQPPDRDVVPARHAEPRDDAQRAVSPRT